MTGKKTVIEKQSFYPIRATVAHISQLWERSGSISLWLTSKVHDH
jgi:hypothetical protein